MDSQKKTSQYKTINGLKHRVCRYIMADHLGRDLEVGEHVYHVNGDSKDNRLENLILIKKTFKNKT